jgi:uncharacterized protein
VTSRGSAGEELLERRPEQAGVRELFVDAPPSVRVPITGATPGPLTLPRMTTSSPRSLGRRSFLTSAAVAGVGIGLGPGFWQTAFATPAPAGPGPYGPIDGREPDANGLILPPGFRSRVIARTGEQVPGTGYVWPTAPDGQATFPLPDGGWVLVTNSEWASNELLAAVGVPSTQADALGGGVSAIRFAKNGRIVDAYRILAGSNINCAGGPTPWGTWFSGEEFDLLGATPAQVAAAFGQVASDYFFRDGAERAGQIWECDPTGSAPAAALPALGVFSHEAAAVDPATNAIYLTEDQRDGLLYRFLPADPRVGGRPDLSAGQLQAARVTDPGAVLSGASPVEWLPAMPANPAFPLRFQVPGATRFQRGEGMWFDSGTVYFTTTADNRVWAYECASATLSVIYDIATAGPDAPLRGADNITVHPQTGDIYVAEDGGNMELVTITAPDDPNGRFAAPFARFTPADGVPQVGTEVTGPCFDPSGTRMYVSSQRGVETSSFPFPQRGITYEITGPFRSQRRNAGR